jgi:hypothetical protein
MGLPTKGEALLSFLTLQRGNAASDAPASRNAGAFQDEFPRWSVETIKTQVIKSAYL